VSAHPARPAAPGARVLLGLVVLAHLVVLYAPRAPSTGGVSGLDEAVHVVVFAAVVWAGRRAGAATAAVAALALLHAPLSEALQHWLLPGRTGDPGDVVADVVGVALGALLPVRARSGPPVVAR
jgi:VanZ family protein